jgi:hypothetical protein
VNTDIEVDHKNGLYNDPRVLNLKTQTLDDFQSLYSHCNKKKRETIKVMKETGIRYPATNIPQLSFNIDYTYGDSTYDIKNCNTLIGTYWYDPVDFMKKLIKKD